MPSLGIHAVYRPTVESYCGGVWAIVRLSAVRNESYIVVYQVNGIYVTQDNGFP